MKRKDVYGVVHDHPEFEASKISSCFSKHVLYVTQKVKQVHIDAFSERELLELRDLQKEIYGLMVSRENKKCR